LSPSLPPAWCPNPFLRLPIVSVSDLAFLHLPSISGSDLAFLREVHAVSEFDGSAPLTRKSKSITIPRLENTWRPEKKMKNINLASVDLQFETEVDEDPKTNVEYGLNLRNRVNNSEQQDETSSVAGKSVIESLWDQKYKEDMENLADEDGPEKYEEVPIENFAAAVLSSYGWSEGKGIGRNAKADVPVYEHPRRMGGFGAMVDPVTQRQMRHNNTMQSGVGGTSRIDDVKNAIGQEFGDKKGKGGKQDQIVSEVTTRDEVDKDGPQKRRDSLGGYEDPHGSYEDKRDRRRDDKKVDRTYGGHEDKRERSRDDRRAYKDMNDRRTDDKRGEKGHHDDGRKDHISRIRYKEKRDRSRDEERVDRSCQEDNRRERDKRAYERSGDRGQYEEGRKRSIDRNRREENIVDYGREGDNKLHSRSTHERGQSKKGENAKREKGINRDEFVDEKISEAKAVSWLTSHIRVRVISKEFRQGKFYLKKGEVVDVTGPWKCIVSIDESNEIIEGVHQEMLETALPKRGGPVIVLYGKHKGVFGKLVQRDSEEETAMVQDAETSEMITVSLDQIAEYIGDPNKLFITNKCTTIWVGRLAYQDSRQVHNNPTHSAMCSRELDQELYKVAWVHMGKEFWDLAPNMCKAMYISKYFSDPQYYFQVNEQYVRNKLKVILLPFLHRGHWTRIAEQVGGKLSHKPPIYDINAPDLYIPLMAFGTYVVLAGFAMGIHGKFSPEALTLQFSKGLIGWFFQILLLKASVYFLGSVESPLLDIVAYGGYAFVGISISVLARIAWSYSYYGVLIWTCLCMGILLVKTLKRVLFAPARSYDKDTSKYHYFLLCVALAQFPLFFWLGYISV
ncbi:MOS2 protein, partial [Nymphaea thermarum]